MKSSFLQLLFTLTGALFLCCCQVEDSVEPPLVCPQTEFEVQALLDTTVLVSFTASDFWTLNIPEKYIEWISPQQSHGSAGSQSILITISGNPINISRTALLNLSCLQTTEALQITQLANETAPDIYTSADYSTNGEYYQIQGGYGGHGVKLIFMGDGFTDKDIASGRYNSVMKEAMENFFSIEPTKTYREWFDCYVVNIVSHHGIIAPGTQTALGVYYGRGTRLLMDNAKAREYAEQIPSVDIDKSIVIIVVNSPRYGGTCWMYESGASFAIVPYVPGNELTAFANLILHEAVGHGLGRLSDEYIDYTTSITPEYLQCFNDDREKYGLTKNLTLSSDKNKAPWWRFFQLEDYSYVGMYEGGYHFLHGVWRAERRQCMSNNIPYFGAHSRWLIVNRIAELSNIGISWDTFLTNDKYEPYIPTKAEQDPPHLAEPIKVPKD